MYIPKHFRIDNPDEIIRFLKERAFGIFISSSSAPEPQITHLPFLLQGRESGFVIESHLAKANPHVDFLKAGKVCSVVVPGVDSYVSSSVYEHENVPTWNYQAVHIHGLVEVLSREELETLLRNSVNSFESWRHHQLDYDQFNKEMLNAYLNEIVGIRIVPYKIEAKYKLSQNRNAADFQHVVNDLSNSNDPRDQQVAEAMKNLRAKK